MKSFVVAITRPQPCFSLPSHTRDLWIWGYSSEALSGSLDRAQARILPFVEVNPISSVNRGNFLPDMDVLASAKKTR